MPEAGWVWIRWGCARVPSAGFAGRHIQNSHGLDDHTEHHDTGRLHFAYMDNEAPMWHHKRADNQARLHDSNRMRGHRRLTARAGGAA